MAMEHPSVFLGAGNFYEKVCERKKKASQSGFLGLKYFADMFTQYRETLNNQFPSIFDVFGEGKNKIFSLLRSQKKRYFFSGCDFTTFI